MSPTAQLTAFAQSVYLAIKNRYFDDIVSDDGNTFILQIADFINQYLDEIETEVDPDGKPVDWRFSRQPSYALGTAVAGNSSIDTPTEILNLLTGENRYVQITQDGTVIANFAVVNPEDISNQSNMIVEDMCSVIGSTIVFSRVFTDAEGGGAISGDVTLPIPRIVASVGGTALKVTNVKALTTIKPRQLLVLGVAKNSTLPDIVQGKLSPSYVQKYNDLLQNAIARNTASSLSDTAVAEDYGYIGGIGF